MSDENDYDEEVSCIVANEDDDPSEVDTKSVSERCDDTPAPSEAASEVVVVASDDEEDDEVLATVLVEEGDSSSTSNKRSRKKPGPKPKRKRTSDDCEDAAEEARAMLQHIVTRLPMSIGEDGTSVRALGRIVKNDERFSSSHHIYPVGFSCDRYEFSPVHGRIVKFRCTILDGKNVRKKQEENGIESSVSDGPLFRIMWGPAIDEEPNTMDYEYNMNLVSSAIVNGKTEDTNSEELTPDEGMRVRVKYEQDEWYTGTIIEVEEQTNGESEITIQYDDGSVEHANFPDPDIVLYVPGCEDVAMEDGVVEPSEINGKSVTAVTGKSAIEAWGKAMVAMGLIDGITLEKGLEAVSDTRKTKNVEKDEEKEDSETDAEEETAEEQELRGKIESMKEELEKAREKDREASIALADARLSCLGPFLCNPFQDKEPHYPQQVSWLTTAIRKEKAKMGSTGNKRKIVTATDLLQRNNTFFNADIESLVEGLPGTESLSNYLFHNFRFGFMQSAISESWRQEAHQWRKEREKESKKRKSSTTPRQSKPAVSKPTVDPEREAKRQKREDERDARKRQKEEEMELKKKARIEERLARLTVQVDERLFKEACFQREKVVLAVAKSYMRECYRRRKAAELVSMQSVLDDRVSRIRPHSPEPLPPLSPLCQEYDEDVLRCWDFVTSYGETLVQWGYVDKLPTLDSLQQALNGVDNQSENPDGQKSKTMMTRKESVEYLTKLCIALCKPLAVSLTRLLFASLIALNPALQKDFGAAFFAEIRTNTNKDDGDGLSSADLLPVNKLTWQEIARLAFLSDALGELGNAKHEVAHFLRGYRSMGHPNSKEAKRLRRTEDFPIAVLKQVIDQATKTGDRDNVAIQTSTRILTPCKPSACPKNWEFYIHNIRGLSLKKLKLIRSNLKNALEICQVTNNNDSNENGMLSELKKSEAFLDKMLEEKNPSQSDFTRFKKELLQLLDKATGETFSSDSVKEPVYRTPLCLERGASELNKKSIKWPTRYRMGLPFFMSMNEKKYKGYVHQREEYMADALKLKEKMEKGDEEEDDDDDDDDDDDENQGKSTDTATTLKSVKKDQGDAESGESKEDVATAGKSSEKQSAEVVATVVENLDDSAKAEVPTKIGKVTPYDDFCADIPTAPDLIRRCLAVLRTVSQTNAAEPFIYPVDPQTNPGYYETILQPMCMREIGIRLISAAKSASSMIDEDAVEGYIDNVVTQFGRNIRLIAQNCSCYPNAGATVIAAGEELLRIFERLLLDWVLAPKSLLPPLDNLDDDKCVEFHESDEDSLVLLCDGCEGKYNMGRLNPPLREVPKGDWFCPRCLNGRCWKSLDPRIKKRLKLGGNNGEMEPWTIECSHFMYPEDPTARPTLLYDVRNRFGSTKTLTIEELDKALNDQGSPVDPVHCIEAVAESPGYALGANQGLHENLVPVPSNPTISDSAGQAFFSSSVFEDTIISSSTLMLINPENQSKFEWSRLLSLLVMKCASSEMMGSLASDMEGEAADKMKNIRSENSRLDIQDILPLTNGDNVDKIPKQAALPVKQESIDREKVDSDAMAVVVEANAIEVVKNENVDGKEATPSPTTVQSNGNLVEPDSVASIEAKLKQERAAAIEEKEKRQKLREESIVAFSVRNHLRPTFASFEEDNISLVVDNTLGSKEKGLNLAATRCRGISCDLCGLSDIALGSPLVRVPNAKEWSAFMPHYARNRKIFVVADMSKSNAEKDDSEMTSKTDNLVAITIKIGGELFSFNSDERFSEDITDGGMLEFLPRNEEGYQQELQCRLESSIPFLTGSLSAHECCAVSAHNARKDQLIDEHKESRRQLLEKDSGMLCGRTLSLGSDHCGRTYWKFKADKALFICPNEESKSWLRYSDSEVIASVIAGLGKETIAAELIHAFPEAAGLLKGRKWVSQLLKRQYIDSSNRKEEEEPLHKVNNEIENEDEDDEDEEPYQVGEEVLVESKCGRMLWDASVIATSHESRATNKINGYRVRYKGWSSRFDEWVTPFRVVEPVDNNISIQQEMREDLQKGKINLPKQLRGMNARRYVNSPDRARGNARAPDFTDIARISPLSSSSEIALGVGRAGLVLIEAALPEAAVDTDWGPTYSTAWRNVVQNATGPSTLMACAFLLEEHLDPEWMDPHMIHLLSCLPQRWKAIREATVSSLCLRITMLDQSIHYNANEHLNRVEDKKTAASSSNGF